MNSNQFRIGYSLSYESGFLEADQVDFENGDIILGYYNDIQLLKYL